MTLYPRQLEQRFAHHQADVVRRLKKLETRTSWFDTGSPLNLLPGEIDPAYTTGDPHVYVNGSANLTGPYQYLTSYTPTASDAVLLAPVVLAASGATWVILGKLSG